MDQEWDLAKQWGLPPLYSAPNPNDVDVWRLIVTDETGVIPLGERLKQVAHGVVSLVVQTRIAMKHDTDLGVQQFIDSLTHGYALLQQVCAESTEQQRSPSVEATAADLLKLVTELTIRLQHYLGDFASDDSEDEDDDDDGYERSLIPESQSAFRGRKAMRTAKELRQLLQSFTDYQEETSHDGWSDEDVPF